MHKSALPLCVLLILSAYSKAPEHEFAQATSDTTLESPVASAQNSDSLNSQTTTQHEQAHLKDKRFIINVNVHFHVADVVKTANTLESLTLNTGGYLQKVHIFNDDTDTHRYPIGDGNIKMLTQFVRQGQMVVRIPKERVGEFLKGVQEQMVFLNNQEYTAKDVALDLQREQLHAQIEAQRQADLARLNPTKTDDLVDKSAHIDAISQSKYHQALAKLDRQVLIEQVAFSTISLNFYQNPQIFEQIAPNTDAYVAKDNRANFGHKFIQSLYAGWGYFLEFVLWLVSLWALVLGLGVGVFLWRFFKKRGKFLKSRSQPNTKNTDRQTDDDIKNDDTQHDDKKSVQKDK